MRLLFCVILLATCATAMFGQAAAGNIIGTVVDASGAAVPKAKVDLQNVATGVVTSTTTDARVRTALPIFWWEVTTYQSAPADLLRVRSRT